MSCPRGRRTAPGSISRRTGPARGRSGARRAPAASEEQVTRNGGFAAFESPDGHYLYYAKGRSASGLWRKRLPNGDEEAVLDQLKPGYWGYWAVVENGIYFADQTGSSGPGSILLLRFRQPERAAGIPRGQALHRSPIRPLRFRPTADPSCTRRWIRAVATSTYWIGRDKLGTLSSTLRRSVGAKIEGCRVRTPAPQSASSVSFSSHCSGWWPAATWQSQVRATWTRPPLR